MRRRRAVVSAVRVLSMDSFARFSLAENLYLAKGKFRLMP